MSLLQVEDLNISFQTRRGPLHVVRNVSFQVHEGETLGLVGESGCGKSLTAHSLLDLLPTNAQRTAKELSFAGKSVLAMSETQKRQMRGKDMAMIFQDPMGSLNPSFTIGMQLMETLIVHEQMEKKAARLRALELLNLVGIACPEERLSCYPHELSGGMCQRVMIAMALSCRPRLLIADEPTTALDVTIQAQILGVLRDLQRKEKMALIFISHDLGTVAHMTENLVVMYAGEVVEKGPTKKILRSPSHPYTKGLLDSLPATTTAQKGRLFNIPGTVPDLYARPSGCQFAPRCSYKDEQCETAPLLMAQDNRMVRCLRPIHSIEGSAR